MKEKAAAFLFLCLILSCLVIKISAGFSGGGGGGRSGGGGGFGGGGGRSGGGGSFGGGGGRSGGGSSGGSSSRGGGGSGSRGSGGSGKGGGGRSSGGSGKGGGGGGRSNSPGAAYHWYYDPITHRYCWTIINRCNAAGSINQHKGSAFPLVVTLTAIALVM